ncbi:hypothetical protein SEVIR_5G416450v4 [Setaria viridis]|uniref:Uncharacterized protein n=1 Tax=Setaria viridis TaxID=4556 RepID=A0A4U6UU82_SETVI|nr:hypothetical protein SEVIR_5G416450v2 [Setaria viridis]
MDRPLPVPAVDFSPDRCCSVQAPVRASTVDEDDCQARQRGVDQATSSRVRVPYLLLHVQAPPSPPLLPPPSTKASAEACQGDAQQESGGPVPSSKFVGTSPPPASATADKDRCHSSQDAEQESGGPLPSSKFATWRISAATAHSSSSPSDAACRGSMLKLTVIVKCLFERRKDLPVINPPPNRKSLKEWCNL